MDARFGHETLLFGLLYLAGLVGTGVLAAIVDDYPLVLYLIEIWTEPVWLIGVGIGLCLWLLFSYRSD